MEGMKGKTHEIICYFNKKLLEIDLAKRSKIYYKLFENFSERRKIMRE